MAAVLNLEKCEIFQGQGSWIGKDLILPLVALLQQSCFSVLNSAPY